MPLNDVERLRSYLVERTSPSYVAVLDGMTARIAMLEAALREECRKHELEGFFDTPSHNILNLSNLSNS